jgi:hypothetical protein
MAGVERLDLMRGFLALEDEQHVAGTDEFSGGLQPLGEDTFLHGPAEAGNGDGMGHGDREWGMGSREWGKRGGAEE